VKEIDVVVVVLVIVADKALLMDENNMSLLDIDLVLAVVEVTLVYQHVLLLMH
jgi:hypothetical protein